MALNEAALKTLAMEIAAAAPPPLPDHNIAANDPFPTLLQTPRARAVRRIAEIVQLRGWRIEVMRILDQHEATHIDELPDDAVHALHRRMEYFEDCVQCACDPDDAPPAR